MKTDEEKTTYLKVGGMAAQLMAL